MDISVIIPTFNHAELLKETLDRLSRQALSKDIQWEAIIVDNHCTDNTGDVVESARPLFPVPLRLIRESRQGVSWARNAGAACARGRYLAFVDDDTLPEHHWLGAMFEAFKSHPCDGVIGRIELHWRTARPRWLTDELLGFIGRLDYGRNSFTVASSEFPPNGGNMAFTRAAFERVGGFNPALGRQGSRSLLGGEEPEFFERFLRHNYVAVYSPDSVVYHVIDKWRMRKSYFRGVHFHEGRMRGHGLVTHGGRAIAGVPLYLFSQFGRSVSEFARVAWNDGLRRSLRKEMIVWYFLGFMMGCLQRRFARKDCVAA